MSFEVKTDKVMEWIAKWENSFGSIARDPASIKTLIYLTLLERQNESTSYRNIADELKSRGVIEGEMDFVPLRNGMFQIRNALETDKLYEIVKKKGKEANYILKRRSQTVSKTDASNDGRIINILDPDLRPSADFVARRLMGDRRMPFYGIYLPMRAAS